MAEALLKCNIAMEKINNGQETKTKSCKNGELSLCRNQFKEIVLVINGLTKAEIRYTLYDIKIFCKFMKDGKSTLNLLNHDVRLLLSNCPPDSLKKFFRILSVKMASFKKSAPMSMRKQLLLGLPKSLEDISPLNEKDMEVANAIRRKQPTTSNLAISQTKKRKLPFADQTNQSGSSTSEPPQKKLLSLPVNEFSKEQKRILSMVKQGKNLFFTGSAGTGKSFLLRHIIGMLPPAHTVVTASTGVAACHIGGTTLHSFVGIGKGTATVKECIELVKKRAVVLKQWRSCKHLIIDEISMIDAEYFDKMEHVARVIRGSDDPFGGIHLIFSGDFFQLPPVSRVGEKKKLCFQSKSWQDCIQNCWEMMKVYRQSDAKFINLLHDIRIGRCDAKTTAILKATRLNKLETNNILATKLCTHRENVDQTNREHLQLLPGPSVQFLAQDSSDAYSLILDRLLPDTRLLELKKGTQVMLTKNILVSKGLVNGARGIVVKFSTVDRQSLPVVRFMDGSEHVIKYERWSAKITCDVIAIRKQIPLKLAWAISIHKSQGMSLDCVEMSLAKVFENGQTYVALSRARSLEGLRVLDFDPSCVRSNVDVLRFYRELRNRQKACML